MIDQLKNSCDGRIDMPIKKLTIIIALLFCALSTTRVKATEPTAYIPIENMTSVHINNAEVETAFQTVVAKYHQVLPPELFEKIDRKKIMRISIVPKTTRPDLSEAGFTKAEVDLDTKEVETIEIELLPGCSLNGRAYSFQAIMEHEFGHAIAYMIGLPNAQEIGHSIQIEQLRFSPDSRNARHINRANAHHFIFHFAHNGLYQYSLCPPRSKHILQSIQLREIARKIIDLLDNQTSLASNRAAQ
jgi:hypothetical protein